MSTAVYKILLVLGGLLVAAGITYWPWTYIDHFTGAASSVYGHVRCNLGAGGSHTWYRFGQHFRVRLVAAQVAATGPSRPRPS